MERSGKKIALVIIFLLLGPSAGFAQLSSRYQIRWFDSSDSLNPAFQQWGTLTHENAFHSTNSTLPAFRITLEGVHVGGVEVTELSYVFLSRQEEETILFNDLKISEVQRVINQGSDDILAASINVPSIVYDSVLQRYRRLLSFSLSYEIEDSRVGQGEQSVLNSGPWFKLGITTSGIYQIDPALFPVGTDPRTIKVYGNGGKMLPQENHLKRPFDLIENAITVIGEEDGVLNPGDLILFYGSDPDSVSYQRENGLWYYENNFYSDTTYYFVTFGGQPGKRMVSRGFGDIHDNILDNYPDYLIHEIDENTILIPASGRRRFGERFASALQQNFDFELKEFDADQQVTIRSVVAGQSFEDALFTISANGNELGQQIIRRVNNVTYGLKGTTNDQLFQVSPDLVGNQNRLNITLEFERAAGVTSSVGFLDYLLISYYRRFDYQGSPKQFRFIPEEGNQEASISIQNSGPELFIWNISDPGQPYLQEANFSEGTTLFSPDYSSGEYLMFEASQAQNPVFLGQVANQNLKGLPHSTLIIISAANLLAEAERYAAYKRTEEGLSVEIVTVQQIYNEFSGGSQDVTAIRDFIRYQFLKSQGTTDELKYVLLFGKGSNDYKDVGSINFNLVPTYQSRNSLDNIFSYGSDDYYGFMDENEGAWIETAQGDHLLDLGIGRLPVKTLEEAKIVVDKIINYKTNFKRGLGDWRNKIVFVADDQDNNAHQKDAENLSAIAKQEYPSLLIDKLYLDAFPQINNPTQTAPAFNQALVDKIEEGALIVNFSGHGGETGWMDERTFQFEEIENLKNRHRLALFITATCEFGRNDDATLIAGGERLLLNPSGGAVALITTARPVFRFSNFLLNKSLIEVAFKRVNGKFPTLGDIIRETKNNSLRGPNNRNFSLLGDPSMTLNYPELEVVTRQVLNARSQTRLDTVGALSRIEVLGEVSQAGNRRSDFDGIVRIRLFDKSGKAQTLGTDIDSPVMEYEIQNNILFNGSATVKDGEFSFETIIPKNIDFSFGEAEINYYVQNDAEDGNGFDDNLVIGGSEAIAIPDNNGPALSIYLNDTLFRSGQTTGPNPLFIARLSDEEGINISNAAIGHEIKLSLNGEEFNLNEYFISDLDDFTNGWVFFNLSNLEKGNYSLVFSASDAYNNRSSETLEFVVGEEPGVKITDQRVFPNPLTIGGSLNIILEHNRENDDLMVDLSIIGINGDLIYRGSKTDLNSSRVIEDITWNSSSNSNINLKEGIYIMRLDLQSLTDGSISRIANRLILIK
jgi:hypothetical protein